MDKNKNEEKKSNIIAIAMCVVLVLLLAVVSLFWLKKDSERREQQRIEQEERARKQEERAILMEKESKDRAYEALEQGTYNMYKNGSSSYLGEHEILISEDVESMGELEFGKKSCWTGGEVLGYEKYRGCCKEFNIEQKYYDEDKNYIVYLSSIHTEPSIAQAELKDVHFDDQSAHLVVWDNSPEGSGDSPNASLGDRLPFYIIIVPADEAITKVDIIKTH